MDIFVSLKFDFTNFKKYAIWTIIGYDRVLIDWESDSPINEISIEELDVIY